MADDGGRRARHPAVAAAVPRLRHTRGRQRRRRRLPGNRRRRRAVLHRGPEEVPRVERRRRGPAGTDAAPSPVAFAARSLRANRNGNCRSVSASPAGRHSCSRATATPWAPSPASRTGPNSWKRFARCSTHRRGAKSPQPPRRTTSAGRPTGIHMTRKDFPIPVVTVGPGSQEGGEEQLSYIEMPKEMSTFSMPSLPDPEQARDAAGSTRRHCAGWPRPRRLATATRRTQASTSACSMRTTATSSTRSSARAKCRSSLPGRPRRAYRSPSSPECGGCAGLGPTARWQAT